MKKINNQKLKTIVIIVATFCVTLIVVSAMLGITLVQSKDMSIHISSDEYARDMLTNMFNAVATNQLYVNCELMKDNIYLCERPYK